MNGTFSNGPAKPFNWLQMVRDCNRTMRAIATENGPPPKILYVRHDVWPEMKARIAEKAMTPDETMRGPLGDAQAMAWGIPVRVVDWLPAHVPWCTDVELERIGVRVPT